jgi:hypothetical protein
MFPNELAAYTLENAFYNAIGFPALSVNPVVGAQGSVDKACETTRCERPMSRTGIGGLLIISVLPWLACGKPARTKDTVVAGNRHSVPVHTSICEVTSTPAAFYDKNIIVYGCLSTDGVERNGLIDETCPHTGIKVGESEKLSPEQRTILEGIAHRGAGPLCGMFSGTFRASTRLSNIIVDTDVLEVASVKLTISHRT